MFAGRVAGDRGWTASPIGENECDQIEQAVGASVPSDIRSEFAFVAGGWRFNADSLLSVQYRAATWAAPEFHGFLLSIDVVECGCDGVWKEWDGRCPCVGYAVRERVFAFLGSFGDDPGHSVVSAARLIDQARFDCHYLPFAVDRAGNYHVLSLDGPALRRRTDGTRSPIVLQGGMVARGHVGLIGQERHPQLLPARSRWFLIDVDCAGGRVELGEYRYSWTVNCARPSVRPPISARACRSSAHVDGATVSAADTLFIGGRS